MKNNKYHTAATLPKSNLIDFLVINVTFSNISAISWQSVLVVEEAGENQPTMGKQLMNFITCGCESSAHFL